MLIFFVSGRMNNCLKEEKKQLDHEKAVGKNVM